MPKMTMKDGVVSFEDKILVEVGYTCECGAQCTIKVELPENVTFQSEISFPSLKCLKCEKDVKLPKSRYTVKNGKLVDIGEDSE